MRGLGVAVSCLLPVMASAGEVELGAYAGWSMPTYEQTFSYNASGFGPPKSLPGISIAEQGSFSLTAKGGLAAGGSLTFYPTDAVGIEARIDTVGIQVDATGVHVAATVTSSYPFIPSFTASVDLPPGRVEVDRVTPISLGLKLRTPGRVRFFLALGGSYLPKVGALATQTLGVNAFPLSTSSIDVGRVAIRAAPLEGEGGRFGGTGALGFQVPLGSKASFQAEARVFAFAKETLGWQLAEPAPGPFSDLLVSGVARIDPVALKPTFYQATAGLTLRF